MKAEKLLKEMCSYSLSELPNSENDKDLIELQRLLNELETVISDEIFIKLDNLIGLVASNSLNDGYIHGFKDGSKMMAHLLKEN